MTFPRRPAFHRAHRRGFALVSTLAVLVIVAVILVAYASMMQSERAASQNFTEHDRAEAVALGMLNRILVDHASPTINSAPLLPFSVDKATALPTTDTAKNYYGSTSSNPTDGPAIPVPSASLRKSLLPIYEMVPDEDGIFARTGLVRTSRAATSAGGNAYTADYWAYDGLTRTVLGSTDAQPAVVPQWVDYYETDPATGAKMAYPTAQIAFAIWDEGGKLDINLAGTDDKTTGTNGMAPHDLQIEKELSTDPTALLAYLNGADGQRQRNNFSLRQISSPLSPNFAALNDKGDDRWLFSVRELVEKKLLQPLAFRQVTTMSRDFDVRPEWDGNRAPLALRKLQDPTATLGAEDFLRSYINNPNLFTMFYGAGGTGPTLVKHTLSQTELERLLKPSMVPNPNASAANKADWMQVLRLLAMLRRSLPPYATNPGNPSVITPSAWTSSDIWAVGLNVIQASATASDHNIVAYDTSDITKLNQPFSDPGARIGVRISPYITEFALKLKMVGTNQLEMTEYIEIWNPYPFKLNQPDNPTKPMEYRVGVFTGAQWPRASEIWGKDEASGLNRVERVIAPNPGEFKVIRIGPRIVTTTQKGQTLADQEGNPNIPASKGVYGGFEIRLRPYLQDMEYYSPYKSAADAGGPENIYYAISMPSFWNGISNSLYAYIHPSALPTLGGPPVWYSFQIDDPRMGSLPRNGAKRFAETGVKPDDVSPALSPETSYTWIGYVNKHSLASSTGISAPSGQPFTDPDINNNYNGKTFNSVKGYNANFGVNWPGASPTAGITNPKDFAKMMATFALPGRPLLNVSELGTVFAFRPWTTLNFANKVMPDAMGANSLPTSPDIGRRPSALLDYYTTIGTTTTVTTLRYVPPSKGSSSDAIPVDSLARRLLTANVSKRYQDKSWLFESVKVDSKTNTQTPEGNLRAIRGRINLNTASEAVLTTLLKAPYRMPASIGLQLLSSSFAKPVTTVPGSTDFWVTVKPDAAEKMAHAISLPITDSKAIRPLRNLSDLSQLYDNNNALMTELHADYPPSVVNAMIGRLAQFGTVREQAYTIDLVARTLNPAVEKARGSSTQKPVVTGEVRLQARIFFDSFSRKAFIESIQYR